MMSLSLEMYVGRCMDVLSREVRNGENQRRRLSTLSVPAFDLYHSHGSIAPP